MLQKNAVLQDRGDDPAAVGDRCKWTDERVFDLHVLADDHRPANLAAHDFTAFAELHATGYNAVVVDLTGDLALYPFVQYDGVGGEQVIFFAGVEPPTVDALAEHFAAVVEQCLNGIGNFELAA